MKDDKKYLHLKANVASKSAEESWKGTKVDRKVLLIASGQEEEQGQSQATQSSD
ncbi:MAG TPA: hypothetical protein VNA15_07870 [Candidatus Angelobacter sp.]|nr:hypothetical protein [Candidatus Angelobacter sp.]